MTAPHAGLKAAYEDIAYASRPNIHADPGRLAAIGRLFGLAPADPKRARVLEVGCGDASSLLPLALLHPEARFVGCDLSARLMDRARSTAAALELRNVELVEGDLKAVAPSLGTFDYVIAHGFYSWVPGDVRDAFVAMLGRQLAPGGLAFVSYNVLPGCFVRRIGWDALRIVLGSGGSARERLDATRRELADLAEAWSAMPGIAAHLGREFAGSSERSDSSLYHDDLSAFNEAVYFTSFVQHVGRHGLAFLAEAEPATMSMAALPPRMVSLAASADALAREQYLDFARVRRFRQSIVGRADDVARAALRHEDAPGIHLSAVTGIVQERAAGTTASIEGPLIDLLVDAYPASVPFRDAVAHLAARGLPAGDARTVTMRGCFSGAVDMHADPLPLVPSAGERPRAWRYARWQVSTDEDWVPSLRQTAVRVDDPTARALLAACDGTRDRAALARAASLHGDDAIEIVDRLLERFALAGLFEA